MPLLEARELTRRFGGLVAVDKVSLAVEPLTVTALIGPNGAGKTTFFKMLSGELQPSSGEVYFKDHRITQLGVTRVAQLGIAKSFQITQIFPKLSVEENVLVPALAATRGAFRVDAFVPLAGAKSAHAIAERVLAQVGLTERCKVRASDLSYGEKRRVEIAMALAQKPRVLLLDEPLAGLSREERASVKGLIAAIPRDVTVVMIEHDMDTALELAERVTVLHYGKLIVEGTRAEVVSDARTREVYLGH